MERLEKLTLTPREQQHVEGKEEFQQMVQECLMAIQSWKEEARPRKRCRVHKDIANA